MSEWECWLKLYGDYYDHDVFFEYRNGKVELCQISNDY